LALFSFLFRKILRFHPPSPALSLLTRVFQFQNRYSNDVFLKKTHSQIQDAGSNNFTKDAGITVTASLFTSANSRLLDPASVARLSGTTSVSTTNGLARFSDLTVGAAGFGFIIEFRVLRVGSPDVILVQSAPFKVMVGSAVGLDFRRQPTASSSGVALSGMPQVVLVDKGGNAVTGGAPTISAWLVTDLAQCTAIPPTLIGDVQHTSTGAIAELSTASVAYPCPSVRMRATVSSASFIADSLAFSSDVGPPINFEIESVSHDSVALLWRSPATGAEPSAFFLTYGLRSGYSTADETDTAIRLDGASTETVIKGLSGMKVYFFRICSVSLYSAHEAPMGVVPTDFVEVCAAGAPAALVTAPIQAPEFFEVQYVGIDFVDLRWASPTVGPAPPAYRVLVTCNNISSCTSAEYGFQHPASTLVDMRYHQVDASAASHPGGIVNFRVTNLTAAKGYIFEVVSRAAVVDTVFDQTRLYAPSGPRVQTIYPIATPSRTSITVRSLSSSHCCLATSSLLPPLMYKTTLNTFIGPP